MLLYNPSDRDTPIQHAKLALMMNGFKPWTLAIRKKCRREPGHRMPTINIPCTMDVSERLHRVYKTHHRPCHHKSTSALRSLSASPKDITEEEKQFGTVYSMLCEKNSSQYMGIMDVSERLHWMFKTHGVPFNHTEEH